MGNIAGALESPRFTRLPRPSHSDAIYLPNCSSDAFITLLDGSTDLKKKKKKKKKNPPKIPGLAAFPWLVLYSLQSMLEKVCREPSEVLSHRETWGYVGSMQ